MFFIVSSSLLKYFSIFFKVFYVFFCFFYYLFFDACELLSSWPISSAFHGITQGAGTGDLCSPLTKTTSRVHADRSGCQLVATPKTKTTIRYDRGSLRLSFVKKKIL